MVSDEWWIFHLTKDGWIDGSYKHDFNEKVVRSAPTGTLLTRRYFEKLGHSKSSIERGFENLSGISDDVSMILKKFPHPVGFERF